jgi:hypothetical protein
MGYVLYAIEFKGMPGIGSPLESGNHIVVGCQDIDQFSLAFVSPLKA